MNLWQIMNSRDPVFEETGYKELTTFWSDFSIADAYGINAVKDTYNRGLEYAKTDYKYLTEFVMILNHKIWQHYEKNEKLARVYNDLWQKTHNYALNTLKGEALSYYARTTD